MTNDTIKTKDAIDNHWVHTMAPKWLRPYLRLARADRPIGTWLLLWPCWWSIGLATDEGTWPSLSILILFAIGAFFMRGAGCTINDMADREFDAKVDRTKLRPIPAGEISLKQAFLFLAFQALIGLMVLLQFNDFAIILGVSSLALVIIYPFMKRITYWPQFVLGLTFNWGALLGWAAVKGDLSLSPILLYIGGVFWTLGYDTIYAHQDKEDDMMIGVKSTALKFGDKTRPVLLLFYLLTTTLFAASGYYADMGLVFYGGVALFAGQLLWQWHRLDIDNPETCLILFRSNTVAGWLLFLGIIVDQSGVFL